MQWTSPIRVLREPGVGQLIAQGILMIFLAFIAANVILVTHIPSGH